MIKEIKNKIKVLLIDDDAEDMELFEDAFKIYTPNGLFTWLYDSRKISEYFTEAKRKFCDIIFLDICMPLMDGLTCLKAIRKIKELNEIPVVMFSTHKFDEDIERSFACGANMFVQKPSDFRLYDIIFEKIFCTEWQTRLLNTEKKNYLLKIEGETIFS